MSSVAEAETIGILNNAKAVIPIRTTLQELGHQQPPATTRTDNSTSHGTLTPTIRQKRSKAFDMNIYWIKDRIQRGQFFLFWDKGTNNKVDYFTKHFPSKYHKQIRYNYLHRPAANIRCAVRTLVQGCVNTRNYIARNPKI